MAALGRMAFAAVELVGSAIRFVTIHTRTRRQRNQRTDQELRSTSIRVLSGSGIRLSALEQVGITTMFDLQNKSINQLSQLHGVSPRSAKAAISYAKHYKRQVRRRHRTEAKAEFEATVNKPRTEVSAVIAGVAVQASLLLLATSSFVQLKQAFIGDEEVAASVGEPPEKLAFVDEGETGAAVTDLPDPSATIQATTTSTTGPPPTEPSTTVTPTTTTPPTTDVPTTAPPATAAPTEPGGCNANYSGCVPVASDVDCAGGSGDGPEYVTGPIRVTGEDVYGLDRDGDGVGCE